jgi:serine/threonine protein phosphatase PrpC
MQNQEYTGMGTTVVACVVSGDMATVVSVGDSRAYFWRENELKVLTRDDVWLNETWVRRAFTEEQLQRIPLKNVLSKAIGSKEDIEFPVQEVQLIDNDLIFLCSDGLHGLVDNDQITGVLRTKEGDLAGICEDLTRLANEAGGKDNITCVALKYKK